MFDMYRAKLKVVTLYSQQNFTGKQYSPFNSGVTWSRLRSLCRTSCAALFWTFCNRPVCSAGRLITVAVIGVGGYQSSNKFCRSSFVKDLVGWTQSILIQERGRDRCLFHPAWRVWSVLAPRYFREALKGMLLPQALAESLRTKECQFEWGNTKYANLGVRAFYIKQQNNL